MVNQEKVQEMVQNKRYTGETLRILLFFMSVVEYDNRIKSYTQVQIAEKIKMRQPQISRAIKELEQDKIIIKDGRDYYFSKDFLTKGTFENTKSTRKTAEPPETKSVPNDEPQNEPRKRSREGRESISEKIRRKKESAKDPE